nr:predicted protein [Hordeum vulgare subsp. vulgare]BAJ91650.1 predicted protein [Hordeum vulgare subsp. vulgare]BAJ91884.1 predicted protein [Hordeum vulgare subsp. vulgare]
MSAAACVSFCPSPASSRHGAGPIVDVVVGLPPATEAEEERGAGRGLLEFGADGMIGASSDSDQDAAAAAEIDDEEKHPVRRSRAVVQKFMCERKVVGDGFALRRSIGRPELQSLDPFISLDEFEFSRPAGFSDHPHRGFENVTYMLEGGLSYHDFSGHKGTVNTGDVQWMTAGRGVVHAEMPGGEGVQRGLNLWLNLSSKDKMVAPRYQDLRSRDVASAEKDGVSVKVIAGEALGARSPIQTRTPAMWLDVTMQPAACLRQPVPAGWTACAYVLDGEASFGQPGDEAAGAHQCVVFGGDGDGVDVRTGGARARFLLLAARPHGEAVAMDGPFVMNTSEEVQQAREDYLNRRNGFELAAGWSSGQ